jgi:RNA polymerase sigma-70 factor (ECF subfamily)
LFISINCHQRGAPDRPDLLHRTTKPRHGRFAGVMIRPSARITVRHGSRRASIAGSVMQAPTLAVPIADRQRQFRALLEAHRRIVAKVAGTYARHPDDRADLAQEIAAQLWRAFPGYDPARAFSTWMYRIALNVAISFVRRHDKDRVEPFDDRHAEVPGATGPEHETGEAQRVLEGLIAALGPFDRALLLLWLDDRPQREIAEVLGITETNVATKLGRIRQRLRQQANAGANGGNAHGTR